MSHRLRILITGGTSGIGRAVAVHLTQTCDVWIVGSHEGSVRETLDAFSGLSGSVCDVADAAAVARTVVKVIKELGGIDGAFINAGIDGQGVKARDLDLGQFAHLLQVNLVGALSVARELLPVLTKPGTLVFNASMNAIRPEAQFADYNASKAAVVSLAKTIALEEGPTGITSIALCPGYFPTRMTEAYLRDPVIATELLAKVPLGRFGELSEIASMVDFLLSPAARYLNGSVISPDGGVTI